MQNPNRKVNEPKITLSPPALFALAAVIFFLAGGIFAYIQLLSRGFQKAAASSPTIFQQEHVTPSASLPVATPVATLKPTATAPSQPSPVLTPSRPPPTTQASQPGATVSPEETPEMQVATPTPEATEETQEESPTAVPETPSPSPIASAHSDFPSVKNDPAEQAQVRKEVLARIDLLKDLTQKDRDYLYAQVDRARGFTKLAIIPFPPGKTRPEQYQIDHLLSYLQKPEYRKLFEDPTVVFVVAGYADTKGNEAQNLEISKERADAVAKMLENDAKILNTVRAVGMGGSEFFGHGMPDKNRVVEIWLAAP